MVSLEITRTKYEDLIEGFYGLKDERQLNSQTRVHPERENTEKAMIEYFFLKVFFLFRISIF
jgi:hypothetical protein